jgi:hypothetical protein
LFFIVKEKPQPFFHCLRSLSPLIFVCSRVCVRMCTFLHLCNVHVYMCTYVRTCLSTTVCASVWVYLYAHVLIYLPTSILPYFPMHVQPVLKYERVCVGVETRVAFWIFAKMRKSCESEPFSRSFRSCFCGNFCKNLSKTLVFAKIFVEIYS